MRYHKSRRAKDTNNYSAVDIECIVGKAKARQEEAAKADTEAGDEARPSFNQENGAEVNFGAKTLSCSFYYNHSHFDANVKMFLTFNLLSSCQTHFRTAVVETRKRRVVF